MVNTVPLKSSVLFFFLFFLDDRTKRGRERVGNRERERDHLCIKTLASLSDRALSSRMPSVGGGEGGRRGGRGEGGVGQEGSRNMGLCKNGLCGPQLSELQASDHHPLHFCSVRRRSAQKYPLSSLTVNI